MDLSEISTMLGTFSGIISMLGGVGVFLYKKQNKRLKEAEALLAEANVSKAHNEVKADIAHFWEEQCESLSNQNKALIERNTDLVKINAEKEDRHQQDIKDWESRFTDQTDRLREVQRALISANDKEVMYVKQIAKVEKERDHYKMWRCFREENHDDEGCLRRKPKQPIPYKYIPLESEVDCKECEKKECITINLEK